MAPKVHSGMFRIRRFENPDECIAAADGPLQLAPARPTRIAVLGVARKEQ
jgi:hypothetical protein